MTPRAWCLPNTVTYKSKGLIEREEKGAGSTGKGLKQRKHLLSLRLLTGRAGCTDMHTRTHTHNRPLTVSSLSGFVDVFLEPARLMVACSGLYSKAGKQQLMTEGMLYSE